MTSCGGAANDNCMPIQLGKITNRGITGVRSISHLATSYPYTLPYNTFMRGQCIGKHTHTFRYDLGMLHLNKRQTGSALIRMR